MRDHPATLFEAARRLPGASLLLALPAALIFALPALASVLEYDRTALAAGELWRLVSCHWTHWNGSHLLWDLLTFLVLAVLCEALDRRRLLIAVGLSALAIPTAIRTIQPEIDVYRGLSGLDATLFALYLGLLRSRLRGQGRSAKWPLAALGLLGAKVLYETATGETLFMDSPDPGTVVVPLAHLVGGVVGWLAAAGGAAAGKSRYAQRTPAAATLGPSWDSPPNRRRLSGNSPPTASAPEARACRRTRTGCQRPPGSTRDTDRRSSPPEPRKAIRPKPSGAA